MAMKKKLLFATLLTAPLILNAASPDRNITHPVATTIQEAQATGKMVLVIEETKKGESATLLSERLLSHFLNENFIIEKRTAYAASAAYLIYDASGELVHRVAHLPYPFELAVRLKRGLDADNQYYRLLDRYVKGERNTALLEQLITAATDAADDENRAKVMADYLNALPANVTEATLRFVARNTAHSADPGFAFLLNHGKLDTVSTIVFRESFLSHVNDRKLDIQALASSVHRQYDAPALAPYIDDMVVALLEMREDWAALTDVLPSYLERNGERLTTAQVNYFRSLTGVHGTTVEVARQ